MEDDDDEESDKVVVDGESETDDDTTYQLGRTLLTATRLTCGGRHRTRERRHRQADRQLLPEIEQRYRHH